MIKCTKCGKPQKENTEGNSRYCQGHSIFEDDKFIFNWANKIDEDFNQET